MSETTSAVTTTSAQAVSTINRNYTTAMLENIKTEFLAINDGLDLDFVRIGQMIKLNKKGNFVLARDENESFGDTMDIVIAQGEQRWSLWGKEKSPEDGMLIVAEKTKEEAEEKLSAWFMENQERTERYDLSDIQLRYMAFVVRVDTLQEAIANNETPEIYVLPIATTDSYEYGGYAMELYKGKYKSIGIKAKTAVSTVVTRIQSTEKKRGTNSWIGLTFTPVGLFNPADYGIQG